MSTLKDLLEARQRDYFTDREEAIRLFRDFIRTPAKNRLYRFMVIYGPGGIGKSMLAGKFRDICKENGVASSIANMETTNSPLDVLTAFRENLGPNDNKPFRDFDSLIVKFKAIQAQLQGREKAEGKFTDVVTKVASGVSSAAVGGAITGLALGPVGILLGAAGGTLANSVMESSLATLLKKGLISPKDADFLINLLPNLVLAFVNGINELADAAHGIVLAFDGFEYAEKSKHLQEWITENLLPNLGDGTFVVILGRNKPDGKFWQTYSSFIYQYRLQPFDSADLIKYLETRGVNSNQSEYLLSLTGGLPIGAALWTDVEIQKKTGLSGIVSEQRSAEVLNAVVNRLLENLDDGSKQAMRYCAIPRWFDESTLELLMPHQEASLIFEQLYKYSSLFRQETSGLTMHDEVRRYLLDDFKSRNIKLYRDLNEKMAQYYEQRALSEARYSSLWFKYRVENAYHLLAADSPEGFTLLSGIVDDAHTMGDSSILDALLQLISGLPDNQRYYWAIYLEGEIYFLHQDYEKAKTRLTEAAALSLPPIILSRVLSTLTQTLWNFNEQLAALDCAKRAFDISESINDPRGKAWLYTNMGWLNHDMGNLAEAARLQELGLRLIEELPYKPDFGWALNGLGTIYLDLGDISNAEDLFKKSIAVWNELGLDRGKFFPLFHLGEVCSETGRSVQAIDYYQAALKSWPGNDDEIQVLIRLGEALALRGDVNQSVLLLEKCVQNAREKSKPIYEARSYLFMGLTYRQQSQLDKALSCFTRVIEISNKIGAKALKVNALSDIVQVYLLKNLGYLETLNVIDDLERISQANEYHRQLAYANLYRGLVHLREILHSERNELVSDLELETSASTFYKAMVEALQFNSYTLDIIFDQLYQELMVFNIDIVQKILERLVVLWSSENLEDRQVIEFELSRRERDRLDNHRMPIIDRIKGKLVKNSD